MSETSKLLKAGKSAVTGMTAKNKSAMMMAANPKAVTALKTFVKSPAAKILSKAIPGFSAVSLLASVAGLMKKKDKGGMASPGSGRSRTKTGPAMRAKKSAMTDAQRKSGGSFGRDAIRESGRGKAGPKRNVVKGGGGVVRSKDGKAVKTGKGTAAYKRMMERRKNK
jgi:hypothetical protein